MKRFAMWLSGALLFTGALSDDLAAQRRQDFAVPIHWNRLYDYDELVGIMARFQQAWPRYVTMSSIGRSYEGREMWILTVNDPDTGPARSKPAFWVDANVHGNEVQGAEACLYLVSFLMENRGEVARVDDILSRVAFYVLPTVNPDGRAAWFREPNTASSQRAPRKPRDDDGDGLFDEDPYNDLDGDGEITRMRMKVPMGEGQWRESKEFPGVMERVRGDEQGDYVLLGSEGIDDDGDGRINEDGPGYYDMNRNWPSGWNPDHLQRGAGEYPLSHPETRAIADFIQAHPNIAGVQSFHNSGGMILRGPGTAEYGSYPREDVRVYDQLGADGEFMLPFYNYWVIHEDLYSVSGGFVNWTYEGLGIFSFTNEMWSSNRLMQDKERRLDSNESRRYGDLLMFGDDIVPWTEVDHPFYGKVEVGGSRKMTGRVPPTWLLEEGAHRNAAFVAQHASEMPEVSIEPIEIEAAPGGLRFVDVTVKNHRAIPTRSALAAQKGIGLPDRLTLAGDGIRVLAVGTALDRFEPERIRLRDGETGTLRLESGIPGNGERKFRFLVAGTGPCTVTFTAEKAMDRRLETRIE